MMRKRKSHENKSKLYKPTLALVSQFKEISDLDKYEFNKALTINERDFDSLFGKELTTKHLSEIYKIEENSKIIANVREKVDTLQTKYSDSSSARAILKMISQRLDYQAEYFDGLLQGIVSQADANNANNEVKIVNIRMESDIKNPAGMQGRSEIQEMQFAYARAKRTLTNIHAELSRGAFEALQKCDQTGLSSNQETIKTELIEAIDKSVHGKLNIIQSQSRDELNTMKRKAAKSQTGSDKRISPSQNKLSIKAESVSRRRSSSFRGRRASSASNVGQQFDLERSVDKLQSEMKHADPATQYRAFRAAADKIKKHLDNLPSYYKDVTSTINVASLENEIISDETQEKTAKERALENKSMTLNKDLVQAIEKGDTNEIESCLKQGVTVKSAAKFENARKLLLNDLRVQHDKPLYEAIQKGLKGGKDVRKILKKRYTPEDSSKEELIVALIADPEDAVKIVEDSSKPYDESKSGKQDRTLGDQLNDYVNLVDIAKGESQKLTDRVEDYITSRQMLEKKKETLVGYKQTNSSIIQRFPDVKASLKEADSLNDRVIEDSEKEASADQAFSGIVNQEQKNLKKNNAELHQNSANVFDKMAEINQKKMPYRQVSIVIEEKISELSKMPEANSEEILKLKTAKETIDEAFKSYETQYEELQQQFKDLESKINETEKPARDFVSKKKKYDRAAAKVRSSKIEVAKEKLKGDSNDTEKNTVLRDLENDLSNAKKTLKQCELQVSRSLDIFPKELADKWNDVKETTEHTDKSVVELSVLLEKNKTYVSKNFQCGFLQMTDKPSTAASLSEEDSTEKSHYKAVAFDDREQTRIIINKNLHKHYKFDDFTGDAGNELREKCLNDNKVKIAIKAENMPILIHAVKDRQFSSYQVEEDIKQHIEEYYVSGQAKISPNPESEVIAKQMLDVGLHKAQDALAQNFGGVVPRVSLDPLVSSSKTYGSTAKMFSKLDVDKNTRELAKSEEKIIEKSETKTVKEIDDQSKTIEISKEKEEEHVDDKGSGNAFKL